MSLQPSPIISTLPLPGTRPPHMARRCSCGSTILAAASATRTTPNRPPTYYDLPCDCSAPLPVEGLGAESLASLGAWTAVPEKYAEMRKWPILLVCTAVNSATQLVWAHLSALKFENVSVQLALNVEAVEEAVKVWQPRIVIGTFLTMKVPESVYRNVMTLIVHPGPPGDVGPSSLDWALLGDDGSLSSEKALDNLMTGSMYHGAINKRATWGCVVFQANEDLDAGAVWAWEHYDLPPLGTVTKSQLYQAFHRPAAIRAVMKALCRIYRQSKDLVVAPGVFPAAKPKWREVSVSGSPLPPALCDRPILRPKDRKMDFALVTAADAHRIIQSADSQPGAQIGALSTDSKASILIYGAHIELNPPPASVWAAQGYQYWEDVPAGALLAWRDGALCFKTKPCEESGSCKSCGAAVWVEMGRVPKKLGEPLEPKLPLKTAVERAGHGRALEGVTEWKQWVMYKQPGTFQEIYVDSHKLDDGALLQMVYFSFYNGAMSTTKCHNLLRALQWCTDPRRGNVRAVALMGGVTTFSNGIDLCTIEAAADPGAETMHNIIAMDDVCEFLLSDVSPHKSAIIGPGPSLAERGILTMACLKGNAGAGGVALATNCSFVIGSRTAVYNPGYKAIGLTGAENHTFTYNHRVGDAMAHKMLTDLYPISAAQAQAIGLIDHTTGTFSMTPQEINAQMRSLVIAIANAPSSSPLAQSLKPAPWARCSHDHAPHVDGASLPLTEVWTRNQVCYMSHLPMPLAQMRQVEEEEMTIDGFDPVRSKRYHTRRYAFVRKVKAKSTPLRYARHAQGVDEETTDAFDRTHPDYQVGMYWSEAGLETPVHLLPPERRLALGMERRESEATTTSSVSEPASNLGMGHSTSADTTATTIEADLADLDKFPKVPQRTSSVHGIHIPELAIQEPDPEPQVEEVDGGYEGKDDIPAEAVIAALTHRQALLATRDQGSRSKGTAKRMTKLFSFLKVDKSPVSATFPAGADSVRGTSRPATSAGMAAAVSAQPAKVEPAVKQRMFGSTTRRSAREIPRVSPPRDEHGNLPAPDQLGAPWVQTTSAVAPQTTRATSELEVQQPRRSTRPGTAAVDLMSDEAKKRGGRLRPTTAAVDAAAGASGGKLGGRRKSTVYELPQVPGAAEIDFPCLYEPADASTGTRVSRVH